MYIYIYIYIYVFILKKKLSKPGPESSQPQLQLSLHGPQTASVSFSAMSCRFPHSRPTSQWPRYKLQLRPTHINTLPIPSCSHVCQNLPSTQTSCALWKRNDVNLLQPNRMQDSFKSSSQRPWHLYDFHFSLWRNRSPGHGGNELFHCIDYVPWKVGSHTPNKHEAEKQTLSTLSVDLLLVRAIKYNQPHG